MAEVHEIGPGFAVLGKLETKPNTVDVYVHSNKGAFISWDPVHDEAVIGSDVAGAVQNGGISLFVEEPSFVCPSVTGKGERSR